MRIHGWAAVQKAKEIRAEQIAERTKLAEAAPEIVDTLIENRVLSPDLRDITVNRMQKVSFAISLMREIAKQTAPKGVNNRGSLGRSEKVANQTRSSASDDGIYRSPAADRAWESMLY